MEQKFTERLHQVKEEFAVEITMATQELKEKHKKDIGKLTSNSTRNIRGKLGSFTDKQIEKLVAEKEEAVHTLESQVRIQVKDAENQIRYGFFTDFSHFLNNISFRTHFFFVKIFTHLCFVYKLIKHLSGK